MNHSTIEIEASRQVTTIWLNRPETRNAINGPMIMELISAFTEIAENPETRVVVLRGRGPSFCAGADLNWMQRVGGYEHEENLADAFQLARCFHTIYACPLPTIAMVHGAAMGGGNGLLAACDFALAGTDTLFALSEVKLGLIPATIAPYIIRRIGEFPARDLMLTGRRFNATEAARLGLINAALADNEAERHLENTISQLLSSGPEAVKHCKRLICRLVNEVKESDIMEYTSREIAELRENEEAREGMTAFLEKRNPNWIPEQ
ncbi:enoyl-CoA hydratase/isomerase family protein [Niabella terrae]